MILTIRNLITKIGYEHEFFFDINVINNLQRLSVDKHFDLSYLISESDITLLQLQKFDQLSILAEISFIKNGNTETYSLDIDKPIEDQFRYLTANNLPDYSCEIHLLVNNYAPTNKSDYVSSQESNQLIKQEPDGNSNSDISIRTDYKVSKINRNTKTIHEKRPADKYHRKKDSVRFPKDTPKKHIKSIIATLIITCISGLIIILLYYNNNNKNINELENYLTVKDYNSAVNIYNNHLKNSTAEEEANSILKKAIEDISESINNNDLEYDDALQYLSYFESLQNTDLIANTQDAINEISILELKEYFSRKEYNNAVKLYNKQAKTNPEFATEVIPIINGTIESIASSCFNGKLPYYEALSNLQCLKGIQDSKLTKAIEVTTQTISEHRQTSETIHLAETHLAHGSYHSALKYSHDIPNSSSLHQAAQNCYNKAKEAFLTSLSDPASKEDYNKYIDLLTKYIEEFPDEKDFKDKKKALEDGLKEVETTEEIAQIISSAKEKKEGGDLISALDIIINARKTYGTDNSSLNQTYEEYHTEYINTVKKDIDSAINSSGYSQAQEIVNNALIKYPDDAELKELQASITDYKPNPLNKMDPINIERWEWDEGVPEDPFQHNYSKACNYVIFSTGGSRRDGYVEYRINKKYSTLTGRISPQKDMGENGYGYIQVYADNVLAYTSPRITQKTDAFEFSADMKGAEYIKIKYHIDYYSAILLSDLQLSPMFGDNSEAKDYTPLTALTHLNISHWDWENDSARDLFNTDYSHVCNYSVFETGGSRRDAYIEYRINQEYSKITGKIAPGNGMSEEGNGYVEVYSGDTLLYRWDIVGNKSAPFDFDESIAGVEYLKIFVHVDYYSSIILSDIMLWP